MNLIKCILTNNDCYKANRTIVPKGIMVHSTGANNPSLKRYVQPNVSGIGTNRYNNSWNRSGVKKCVHAFIGKLDNGTVATVQTLPWNHRGWHCGDDANDTHISFEICEDGLTDNKYFMNIYAESVDLCVYLCKMYNLDPLKDGVLICHKEGYKRGIASNHGDVMHWFPKHGKDMDDFRKDVASKLNAEKPLTKVQYSRQKNGYLYEIPFNRIDYIGYFQMNGSKGEKVTDAAKRIKWNNRYPDIIINAELFNTSTYKAASGVVDEGKNVYLPEGYGIAFKDHKTPVFSYKNNVGAVDYIGAYPVLVRNSKKAFTKDPSGLGGSRARTALGIGDNKFGILVIPEQSGTKDATLTDVANIFINNNYDDAIGLDGGGSTAYHTEEVSYDQGRKVRGFICVWYKGGKGNKAARTAVKDNLTPTQKTTAETPYLVKITASVLNVRKGASTTYPIATTVKKNGVYTIVEEKDGWGKLKSGAGWIKLSYTTRLK